jgi:hypothetical protein
VREIKRKKEDFLGYLSWVELERKIKGHNIDGFDAKQLGKKNRYSGIVMYQDGVMVTHAGGHPRKPDYKREA